LAWTGIHGADVPVGADARADAVDADGGIAPIFQAEGQQEKESRQEEGAAEGTEEAGEKEKGSQEETPPLAQPAMTPAGASRRDAPAGHVRRQIVRRARLNARFRVRDCAVQTLEGRLRRSEWPVHAGIAETRRSLAHSP